jgi:hypothetical protein
MRQKARPGIDLRTKLLTKVRCSCSVEGKGLRPKRQIHWLDHWILPLGILPLAEPGLPCQCKRPISGDGEPPSCAEKTRSNRTIRCTIRSS